MSVEVDGQLGEFPSSHAGSPSLPKKQKKKQMMISLKERLDQAWDQFSELQKQEDKDREAFEKLVGVGDQLHLRTTNNLEQCSAIRQSSAKIDQSMRSSILRVKDLPNILAQEEAELSTQPGSYHPPIFYSQRRLNRSLVIPPSITDFRGKDQKTVRSHSLEKVGKTISSSVYVDRWRPAQKKQKAKKSGHRQQALRKFSGVVIAGIFLILAIRFMFGQAF